MRDRQAHFFGNNSAQIFPKFPLGKRKPRFILFSRLCKAKKVKHGVTSAILIELAEVKCGVASFRPEMLF
jgi:hypothetical protein